MRSTPFGRLRSTRYARSLLEIIPLVPSQGKNLNMLKGDRAALPTGDCAALATRDRSPLGTFHVRFAVGKRLTENVFRQCIKPLLQEF
ncbi:hypothetical protein [Cylindrospermopsis raciborskii]|uniref:hypothetical protein n=1 Tax=Cylindrospermopsis raciborskii TaxID=77022 RepID=UPI003DA4445F